MNVCDAHLSGAANHSTSERQSHTPVASSPPLIGSVWLAVIVQLSRRTHAAKMKGRDETCPTHKTFPLVGARVECVVVVGLSH